MKICFLLIERQRWNFKEGGQKESGGRKIFQRVERVIRERRERG
jgi:hypothetical protein